MLPQSTEFRMTRQRKVILEELRMTSSHPTASKVYEMVKRRLPQISLGTVYRNLEILSERGLVRKIELGNAQRRFDGETSEHYHVRCLNCGRVDDVALEPITALEESVRRVTDYQILGHQLEFTGLCPECRKRGQMALGGGVNHEGIKIEHKRHEKRIKKEAGGRIQESENERHASHSQVEQTTEKTG